ncbi:hypothetical protein HYFRA_00008298 [Hymenoscyphus fraxineus]|uniref:Transcriptional regulator n=1 Tax=Hymenoscyphus fraxineus TaxID=746836 RepID=A0A9N9KN07_9HELO|nr:hypothetical protein HYFRA_00008298 [Hymenoscyphus fraxineus]
MVYLRASHADLTQQELYNFILTNPLGILTTAIPSPNHSTIQSSHIPWVLDLPPAPKDESTHPPPAKLRGHIARANPQTKAIIEAVTAASSNILTDEVMVLFNGPVHHYVTPKFYVETKPETGKVVPTWNYSAVQVYGTARVFFDASAEETEEFLTKQLDYLWRQSEEREFGFTGMEGAEKAWDVGEAPESYVRLLKKGIIGIEIEIGRIGGKHKMSQELSEGDRKGVIDGFTKIGTDDAVKLAAIVKERGELKDLKKG